MPFVVQIADCISNEAVGGRQGQCFPFYFYNENGTDRQENITDWTLEHFRKHYADEKITKWDIFYYVYGLLHHPEYRSKYAENLKRELPRIPLAKDFWGFAKAGKELATLHIDYEKLEPYPLKFVETSAVAAVSSPPPGRSAARKGAAIQKAAMGTSPLQNAMGTSPLQNAMGTWGDAAMRTSPLQNAPLSYRVEDKMRLSKDKKSLRVNGTLTLSGIPPEAFEYRLGNRSAVEWVVDQYQVTEDKRSGIRSDPNRADDPEYIVRLVGQVIHVSLETMRIVKCLPSL